MEETPPVEVKELHTVTLSAIAAPFAISWSEDNKISVITTAALHVIEVCPSSSFNGPGVSIKRTMVKPYDDMPTAEAGIDTNTLIWRLDQQDVYRMVLDTQLAPRLAGTKPVEARVKQAQWSPAGMLQERRCLLACLTNCGSVKVHAPRLRGWPIMVNVSAHWVEYCKKQWSRTEPEPSNVSNPQEMFTTLKQRTSQLKTTAMVWSDVMTNPSKFSFLVLGQRNGQIAVWRFLALEQSIPDKSGLNIALVHDTTLQHITALHWLRWDEHTVTLVVGNAEGCVKLIQLSVEDEEITCSGMTDVWMDADRMQVLHINSLPSEPEDNFRIIAVTKNSYVIAFLIQRNEVLARCHHLLGNLTVSGLQVVNRETFLACTHAGYISQLRLTHSEPAGLSMEAQEVPSSINWKNLACYGMSASKNRGLWVITTSICKLYDHLVIRKPAQVIFFYLQGKTEPMYNLINNHSGRLTHQWEFFEIIRLQCVKKCLELDHLYLENPELLDQLSSYQLRMELWLAKITFTQIATVNLIAKQQQMAKHIYHLEQLLFCRHACERIAALTNRSQLLSEDELVSLGLLRGWVQAWLDSNTTGWETIQAIAQSRLALPVPPGMPERELCFLCQEEVTMTNNWRCTVCVVGHRIPRCSRTLRQCVVQPYLQCQICPTVALPSIGPNEESLCMFCDSPLILDDKIKLLSKPVPELLPQVEPHAESPLQLELQEEQCPVVDLGIVKMES